VSAPSQTRSTIVRCPYCAKANRVPAAAAGVPRCGNCHKPLPWITDAGDDDFTEVVESSALPVVVDLWAPWCGPCRMVSPSLETLARELAGRVKLVKIDVDRSPELAARYQVQAVPTLMVLRNGEVLARQPGALPLTALRQWVLTNLPAGDGPGSAGDPS
jgi:thioredoxin 2